ncbi:PAS and helix-turn-helix domain-containing protein [Rhodopirellula halodulae]|uniref:PAS and helix-turn-helix domain-containing protein n=1 Tax=Rhodopirellula halodulae TaxID=2894198 RepID=UPI001E3954E1|nr:PAS and helix-turn-helix domain-containing protein [Rhodopirellula sp. JC737]MCC9656909.1 helix-turn-helix transcriptional regulator [Rhodopirellula sp. JC737]
MSDPTESSTKNVASVRPVRVDAPEFDPNSIWTALTQTAGIGVCVTDHEGRLIYVNDTAMVLFSDVPGLDYTGKFIHDFHPPQYVKERLAMIARVLAEGKPLAIRHIYHGKQIHSTVWPIRDSKPPYHRVVVVSRTTSGLLKTELDKSIETVRTEFIDYGPLSILTQREVEVAVLLGHGMSVPKVAKLLQRSPKTIERHKSAITQKLGLHGQAELVMIISEMGLDLDDAKLKRLPATE